MKRPPTPGEFIACQLLWVVAVLAGLIWLIAAIYPLIQGPIGTPMGP